MQLLLKITVLFAVALATTGLLRRSRASVRHLPLASAFMALPVIVIASLVGPSVPIELPARAMSRSLPGSAAMPAGTPWLLIVWLAGTAVLLWPTLIGLVHARRLRRSGAP